MRSGYEEALVRDVSCAGDGSINNNERGRVTVRHGYGHRGNRSY